MCFNGTTWAFPSVATRVRPIEPAAQIRYLSAGDRALVVEFGNAIDRRLVNSVKHLQNHVDALSEAGSLPGIVETVPTFRSLAIVIDPLVTSVDAVKDYLQHHPPPTETQIESHGKSWRLPVCYEPEYGPDLTSVAQSAGLSEPEVIERHSKQRYSVYLLGFQPGYAFLGDTDSKLQLPRRTEPRVRVPAGSVAIAMKLTCVYPWDCPGGWHLLGRCPVPLFNAKADQPTLFSQNDNVVFESVSATEFQQLAKDKVAGVFNWDNWLDERAP